MFKNIGLLQTASAMARHAVQRHAAIAENVANANTPGYKAKDIEPFSEAFARNAAAQAQDKDASLRTKAIEANGASSPNGNTVSLEDQMWRSAAASRDHETAIAIYAKVMAMLRASVDTNR